jgi:GNAT superfamily N-acetyltransferase
VFLDLEYESSLPFYDFVFADEAEARRVQRILFDAGAGEWAPPHGRAAVKDGELVGLLGGASAADLQSVRLGASMALARAGVFDDEDLAHRMQLAVGCLAQPEEGDYYYGLFAVTPEARSTEVGAELLELSWQEARKSGARRTVGQAFADTPRLIAYYERIGHHWIGEARASDPKTGRELHYRHMAHLL